MQVYDLYAFIMRDLRTCETIPPINGLIPVLSEKDDRWFVVSMLSGESQKLEELDVGDLADVRETIATYCFSKLLLSHCHQVRESGNVDDKARCVLARVDYANHFGSYAVQTAEQVAFANGFGADDIARAYVLMETKDVLAEVPVTKVSDLQQGGKA